MKPITVFILLIVLTSVSALAQTPKLFSSLDGGYIVELPAGALLNGGGPLHPAETRGMGASYANSWHAGGVRLEAAYIKFDREKWRLTFKEIDEQLESLARDLVAAAATGGLEPARNQPIITNGRSGREILFTPGTVRLAYRFYVGDGVIVRLCAEAGAGVPESVTQKFLDSFKLASREEAAALKVIEATPPSLPQQLPPQWMKPDLDEIARGKVKDIVEEIENAKGEPGVSARHRKMDYFFDARGFLTKTVSYAYNADPNLVTVYGFIDGMRVNKTVELDTEDGVLVREPEDGTAKKRDYSTGVVEKYDASKRVSERAFYTNSGDLFLRSIYAYRAGGVEIAEYRKNGARDNAVSQTLDQKGNLIQKTSQNFGEHPNELSYSYKYLAFDSTGNWTKRTVAFQVKENGKATTLEYIEYRTITYYQ